MKLSNLIETADFIDDNTIIIIRNIFSHILVFGNWYQDNILEYHDREVIAFTWKNDNKIYINIA